MVWSGKFRSWMALPLAALLTGVTACSIDGLGQNILLETVPDSSGGAQGNQCGDALLPPPVAIPDNSANAASTRISLRNVATDHPLLTPNGDGVHELTEFNTDVVVARGNDAGPLRVDWRVKIRDLTTCAAQVIGEGTQAVVFAPAPLEVVEGFDALPEGTVVAAQPRGFAVSCTEGQPSRPAACITLDSAGARAEAAMRSSDQGNLLVFAKSIVDADGDGLVDRPDNASQGGTMTLTFANPVRLNSLGFKDVDWNEVASASVTFAHGATSSFAIPRGDNGATTRLSLAADDVVAVQLTFSGSAALTDVAFVESSQLAGDATVNIRHEWGGTQAVDGRYAFIVETDLRDASGGLVDTVASVPIAMEVSREPEVFELATAVGTCDPDVDPDGCWCPQDAQVCEVKFLDGLPTPEEVVWLAPSFITTTFDGSGRYSVTADLSLHDLGLVRKGDGVWNSAEDLQNFIAAVTGVPVDPSGDLFNFDFTQLGVSTPVDGESAANFAFNHFLLDLITDANGGITVDGTWISLAELTNSTDTGPAEFDDVESYPGRECTYNQGFNGDHELSASFCAYSESITLPGDLSIRVFRNSTFDAAVDALPTLRRSHFCDSDGCAIRTIARDVAVVTDGFFYALTPFGFEVVHTDAVEFSAPAVVRMVARGLDGAILSGQCARSIVESADLRIRMDAADGNVGTTCIVNGYFE